MSLQEAYLIVRDGKEVSVPRDLLTVAERRALIAQFQAEAQATEVHADNLEAETQVLRSVGEI